MTIVAITPPGVDEWTGVDAQPGPPKSTLVPLGAGATQHTAERETDSRTAITRALAEYVAQVRGETSSGRDLRFIATFEDWAEPETEIRYPSAIAYTTSPGVYEAAGLTSFPNEAQKLPPPDNRYVVRVSELVIPVTLEVWATDPEERMGLCALLEDAFNPFDGAYGFKLDCPHYFNARASFEPLQVTYMDTEADAIARTRKAMFTLTGRVPVLRLRTYPEARPKVEVSEVGPNVVLDDC